MNPSRQKFFDDVTEILRLLNRLAKHNTRLVSDLLGSDTIFIDTVKVDSKKRVGPVSLAATFCPFCGEKLDNGKS